MWSVVGAKLATLTEIRESWVIDDVADAHEFIALRAEADRWAHEQAVKQSGR